MNQSQIHIQIQDQTSPAKKPKQQPDCCCFRTCDATCPCDQQCCTRTLNSIPILLNLAFVVAQIVSTALDWVYIVSYFKNQQEGNGQNLPSQKTIYIFLGLLGIRLLFLIILCLGFSLKSFQGDRCGFCFCFLTCIHPTFLMIGTYSKLFEICCWQEQLLKIDTIICLVFQDIPTIVILFYVNSQIGWDSYDIWTVIVAFVSAVLSLPAALKCLGE